MRINIFIITGIILLLLGNLIFPRISDDLRSEARAIKEKTLQKYSYWRTFFLTPKEKAELEALGKKYEGLIATSDKLGSFSPYLVFGGWVFIGIGGFKLINELLKRKEADNK